MRRYPKYKDSGVEWIGEIPSGWDKKRIRNIGVMYGGLSGKSGDDFRRDEDDATNKPFIPFTNICNNTYINKNELKLVSINENDNQNRVLKHDLFFMMTSENQEDVGKTSVLKDDLGEVYLNTFCKGFRITDSDVDPLFLNYLLNGKVYRELLSIEGNGYTRINLRQDRVNEFIVLLPPLQEQQQIVTYLDQKTTLIDQIISVSEKKIELLKEQRTSTINQVVTKGLNPKEKMKDSGVEWIGEIPEGWEVKKLKHLTDYKNGAAFKSDDFSNESEIPVIRIGDVSDDINFLECAKVPISFLKTYSDFVIQKGSILIGLTGATIGKSCHFKSDVSCLLNQRVCSLVNSEKLHIKLLYYYVKSHVFITYIFYNCYGGGQDNIGKSDIINMVFPLPQHQEQQQIVTYLDKKTKEIDDLIGSEQKRIGLMKEYRQSLISEVVTGKIKVTK
jgi:type I restriction enzyme S subunit